MSQLLPGQGEENNGGYLQNQREKHIDKDN